VERRRLEIQTLLDGEVCQRGMMVPGHEDIKVSK